MFAALLYSQCSTDPVHGWSLEGVATSPEDCQLFVLDMHDLGRDARVVTGEFRKNKTEDFPMPEDEAEDG